MDTNQQKWFQLLCYYHAKTELYDRSLTDMRSPYDKTEAYIGNMSVRSLSNKYAMSLYQQISKIADHYNLKDYIDKQDRFGNKMHYSAQGWIDTYNTLKEHGELDWINHWISTWLENTAILR